MKTTKCCRDKRHSGDREVPLSQFPRRHTEPDGLAPICKTCNGRNVREATDRGVRQPAGTTIVVRTLILSHIPCQSGGAKFGYPYTDLVLWGCIRCEVKYSSDHGKAGTPSFHWTFNKRQATENTCDIVILIGVALDGYEYLFVMPHSEAQELLNASANHGHGGAIQCAVGSQHLNAHKWQKLAQWQNRFDVIEEVRLKYASGAAA